MNKKRTHLIPAALLLLSFGCQTAAKVKQTPSIFPPQEEEIFPSAEENFTQAEQIPQITEEGYWNTDEVDISEIDKSRKLISFTFDDAPSRTFEQILAVFTSFNEANQDCKASATFFINGKLLDRQNTHLLYAADALGLELGNHTHRHADLTTLSKEALLEEISQTDALLQNVDKRALHLLRAPFGKVNELVREVAPTPLIDWTIDTLDWTGGTAEEIYDRIWEGRFSGAIALMHDGYPSTVTALKKLLPALKEDGYQVVGVSKMIKAHGCRFQKGKVYIRARKQK